MFFFDMVGYYISELVFKVKNFIFQLPINLSEANSAKNVFSIALKTDELYIEFKIKLKTERQISITRFGLGLSTTAGYDHILFTVDFIYAWGSITAKGQFVFP